MYEHKVLKFSPVYSRSTPHEGSAFFGEPHESVPRLLTPNADALLAEMQGAISQKQIEGWAVVSATDVLEGHSAFAGDGSYGYSTTAAIIVILRREVTA